MANKQTTVLQELIEWGDQMMKDHPMKTLSFADAIDKAVELLDKEKEQIEHAYKTCWRDYAYGGKHWEMGMDPNETFKSYYNQTYEKIQIP